MRNISKMFLLSAGIILSLAGCQKGTTPANLTGKAIHFSAAAGSVSTRTAFSGDGTQDGSKTDEFGRKLLTWERIDWAVSDAVMIASDNATIYQDPNTHFATYTVASVTANGDISEAELDEKDSSEELFFTGADSYTFWGIYPAAVGVGADLLNGEASYTINGVQPANDPTATTITKTVDNVEKKLTTLSTDMTQAVMLAKAENQTAESVVMQFYPAFTAFEFTLNSLTSELNLATLELTNAAGKSIAGDVVATIKTGKPGSENESTFAITESATALKYTFPEGTKITKTDYLTFTVFALPEDIEGLDLKFTMVDGEVQKAKLKQIVTEGAEPQNITFGKCKKHNLRGIAVKGGWNFKYLTLDIDVLKWVDIESEISSGDGVQATQFAVAGASNLRELKDAVVDASTTMTDDEKEKAYDANKAYRQYWVFPAGQEVTVTYKIMMPLVGTWKVEPLGDTDAFTVTSSTGALTGNLAGATASATYITLTITGTGTAQKSLYLKTTVTSNGETYNLDSETQLYDMRGYHYFVVNGNVDTE